MEDDFTDAWQDFLLKKYGAEYAKILFAWNSCRCTALMSDLRKELEVLELKKQERKEIYVARIAPYEKKMKQLLKTYGDEIHDYEQ